MIYFLYLLLTLTPFYPSKAKVEIVITKKHPPPNPQPNPQPPPPPSLLSNCWGGWRRPLSKCFFLYIRSLWLEVDHTHPPIIEKLSPPLPPLLSPLLNCCTLPFSSHYAFIFLLIFCTVV